MRINASASSIYRCVKETIKAKKSKPKTAIFKKYESGYLHIAVTYLPNIAGVRKYLFVAIDRATRALFCCLYDNKNAENATEFLEKCINFFTFKIKKILTDNGLEFSNKIYKSKKGLPANKEHIFAQICRKYDIEHRFTLPYRPQTNGMVERANRTLKENTIYKYMFETIYDLSVCINKFVQFYNLERKHTGLVKELKLKTPIEAIKYWFEIKPELFFNKSKDFELNFVNCYKNN